ncbi:MAG: extracellular solute-binding protein [Clostridiaceae bacterium]|nr:extracellular solute-binding protein [Clostridiaceae bacterium]
MNRNGIKKLILFALSISMILSMAACKKTEKTPSKTTPSTTTVTEKEKEPPKIETPADLLQKYDPEIELTAWRFLNSGIEFAKGDDIENNVYIDYYKQELGINLKYAWVVPEEQFEQKLNISVASGDLPDLMWLNNKNLIELAENDLLYDLTDLYETHTSDFTKSILEQDITSFNTAKINGKLMAIPHTGSAIDSLQTLNIRTDWLKNLGLEVPTTMQELLAVAEAFTKNDPDQNGKDDTYGLALTKNFMKDNHAGATGFFAGYHGYIRRWIEDTSGNLVYGSIQPEVRTALLELQNMYKNGLLDPEFGVKDRAKVTESIASSKIGITYGGMSTPGAFLKDSVLNDPNAEWVSLELVSIDGQPAKPITKMPVTRYYAINKKCKNPEAIMKLVEAGSAGYSREQVESEWELGVSKDGIAVFQYQILGYEPAKKNLNAHYNVLEAIEKKDTSILNTEELGYYEKIMQFRSGDKNFWGDERIFGTPSSFDVIGRYVDSGNYLYNKFYGSMTPTMVQRNATLEAMEDEVFTTIIMGGDISAFDKFVEDWNKLGGSDITKEVNEWYQKNK